MTPAEVKATSYRRRAAELRLLAATYEDIADRAAQNYRDVADHTPEHRLHDAQVKAYDALAMATREAADEYEQWARDWDAAVTA